MIFEEIVESDSSPQSTMAYPLSTIFGQGNNLDTIVEGQEQRPKQLPLNHLPPKPKRTSSQERFRGLPSGTPTPLAGSPRTISTSKDMPFLLQHIHNMTDEDFNRLPEEIYKQYVKERADKIIKEIVPEPLTEVNNCYSRIASHLEPPPPLVEETSEDDLSALYPRQSTLYPLAKDQLKVGQDGRYFETRNYNRLKDLGEGGFGMVYACLDTGKDNLFAIKCNSQADEKKVSSIKRECKVMYDIGRHEHITRFLGSLIEDYQCKIQGKSLKMLMECADNGSLDEMLYDPENNVYGLSEGQSLFYLQQILYGVNYLHQQDTLHLDLKCKNILVFHEGRRVKLADFGSAMKKEEVSMKGSPVGFTPHYSAPEVINSTEVPSCSADIWSVMCVLVEMLTGLMPWCSERELSQPSVMLLVGNYQKSNDFSKLVPDDLDVSEGTLLLLEKVLIRNSRDRPTATDLLNDPIIMEAIHYVELFDGGYEENEDEVPQQQLLEEHQLLVTEGTDQATEIVSLPLMSSSQRVSVDSGMGRSLPDRLSSFDSGSSIHSTPRKPSATSKYQILRQESAPFLTIQTPNFIKFEEISAHFNGSGNNTISSYYRPSGLLHSNSAPPDILWNGETRRWMSRGMDDDTERDGPIRRSNLKRTPSAQYVSNGPEVDSPDGRRSLINVTSVGGAKLPVPAGSPTANGMVSVGTQTSLSPTIEGVPPFPGPQTITYYNKSQSSVVL